jgi:hypothetical protein
LAQVELVAAVQAVLLVGLVQQEQSTQVVAVAVQITALQVQPLQEALV